jgi:hypothetical protein
MNPASRCELVKLESERGTTSVQCRTDFYDDFDLENRHRETRPLQVPIIIDLVNVRAPTTVINSL